MGLNPITASENLKDKYIRYLLTNFKISDPDLQRQFKEKLQEEGRIAKGPFLEVSNSFKKGKSIIELVKEGVLCKEFLNLNGEGIPSGELYRHQEKAIKKIISEGRNVIVSTGTGSGKTESFLIPILNHLVHEKQNNMLGPGVRALLLYPMNALANDQIKRLRKLLKNYPDITFGSFTGETEEKQKNAVSKFTDLNGEAPLKNELISREIMRETPPNILITNYAMLEYLMLRPKDSVFFTKEYSKYWKYVVMDEAHTYNGATGIEVAMLMKRLKETLVKAGQLQYILTSASLGNGEKDFPEIATFGKNLCGEPFSRSDIIGAERISYEKMSGTLDVPLRLYSELSEFLNDKNKFLSCLKREGIEKYVDPRNNINEMLYDLLLNDSNYFRIKKITENSLTIYEIKNKLGLKKLGNLMSFVNVAGQAEKNKEMPFQAKYHMFIKSLEGAYITLAPERQLFLDRVKDVEVNKEKLKTFEIVTCKYCNEIYLVGETKQIGDKIFLIQNEVKMSEENYGSGWEYYLLRETIKDIDEDEIDEIDEEQDKTEDYILCGKCGALFNETALSGRCSCGTKYLSKVVKVGKKKGSLKSCKVCGSSNSRGSVLTGFFLGPEGATSVLGTALYEELPDKKKKLKSVSKNLEEDEYFSNFKAIENEYEILDKQFLVFSDSRQSAAYYSTFMNETYHKLLKKRLIYEALNSEDALDGWSVRELIKRLAGLFRKYDLYANKEERNREAWKAVLYEVFNVDRRYSLEGLGLISFGLKFQFPQGTAGLTKEETNTVINVLLNSFRDKAAISYDFPLSDFDREYFSYKKTEQYFSISNRSKQISSWLPKSKSNSRLSYVLKTLDIKKEKGKSFLKSLWENVIINQEFFKNITIEKINGEIGYQLGIDELVVKPGRFEKWYYCSSCNKITQHNVNKLCPTFGCSGELIECDPHKMMGDNHYSALAMNMKMQDLKIREHTAQLGSELAYDVQNKFLKKEINVLSCSTTFEMGVDVGELETVFMRNMPPSPANYAQRAGRAGRRSSSAAFALTFCDKKSHDFSYFKDPKDMILGIISPPKFSLFNEKIAIRHIYAICYSFFWKLYPEYFGNVELFFVNGGSEAFKEYLTKRPSEVETFIKNILPEDVSNNLGIDQWLWLEELLNERDGLLPKVQSELKAEIKELEDAKKDILKRLKSGESGIGKFSDALDRIKKTLVDKRIINFLSQKNLLPKYGFPVDTVELYVDPKARSNARSLNLTRDLKIAISEYAPGSQIIADGKLWTSRYIKKIPGRDWVRYNYGICPNENCNHLNQVIYSGKKEITKDCDNCGEKVRLNKIYLLPEFGFISETNYEVAGTKKPKRTYASDIYYMGDREGILPKEEKRIDLENCVVNIISSHNDTLAVINKTPFYICESCGYSQTVYEGLPNKNLHETHYGRECSHKFKQYFLGHSFKTDVVNLRFKNIRQRSTAENISILYGLLEGVSKHLSIERSDLSGCLNYHKGSIDFVLFDNVPGGAGHVKRLVTENNFKEILEKTYTLMKSCSCGGEIGDTSCYSCLRNYYNQKHHDVMERRFVIEFIKEIFNLK